MNLALIGGPKADTILIESLIEKGNEMNRFALILVVLVVGVLVLGGVVLATVNIPAPSAKVERVIPDSQLGK